MRSNMPRGGYVGRVGGRSVTALALGLFVVGGAACTVLEGVGIDDPGETPDASPMSTSTTPVPTGTATGTGAPDAGPAPTDAAADVTSADAAGDSASDAGTDADTDGSAVDGGADAGADPVMPGVDGVLRGLVGGNRVQDWFGTIRLPNATCPPGATVRTAGQISCCGFAGSMSGGVGRIPVVFDPTTRTGTLAGAPFGPLSPAVMDPDGTMRYQMAAFLEGPRAWQAGIEMSRLGSATATQLAQATRMLENPALMRAVSDSLRYMVVTWNPVTKAFRIRFDLTNFQGTSAGTCGIIGGQETFARVQYDLR
ncbi:MAG: hypothetical protein U0183_08930 [Polyangiaceae bacterium]